MTEARILAQARRELDTPRPLGYVIPYYISTPEAVYPPRSSPNTAAAAAREPIGND